MMILRILCSLFYLSIIGKACDTTLSTQQCNFNVQSDSSNCSTFTFLNCTYYNGDDLATQTKWGSCVYQCCDLSYSTQTYQTLYDCLSYKGKFYTLTVILIVGAVLLFLAIILLWVFYFPQRKLCWENFRKRWCNSVKAEQIHSNQIHNLNFDQVKCSNVEIIDQDKTLPHSKEQMLMTDTNCAICHMRNPTVKLPCSHYFHRICILEWIKITLECPECNSKQISPIAVFCEKCITKQLSSNMEFEKLNQSKIEICLHCIS